MKKLLYLTLVLSTIIMIGCTTDEEVTGTAKVLELYSSESAVEGIIRAAINYDNVVEGDTGKPYVAVPYTNTTGYIQKVSVTDIDMPGTLSVASDELQINPGSHELYIPINGTYPEESDEITMSFNIITEDGTSSWVITTSSDVKATDYQLPTIEIKASADILFIYSTAPLPATGDEPYIMVTYSNGWGRTVDFSFVCDQDENITMTTLDGDPTTGIELEKDNDEHTLIFLLNGEYAAYDETNDNSSIALTVTATTTNEEEPVDVSSTIYFTATEIVDIEILDVSWDSTILLADTTPVNDLTTPIVISYTNGLCREGVQLSIMLVDAGSTGITHSIYQTELGRLSTMDGTIEVSLADIGEIGSPSAIGEVYIYVNLTYAETSVDGLYEDEDGNSVPFGSLYVYSLRPTDATIQGYLIDGATSSTDQYTITVNYELASEGSVISLVSVTGDGLVISEDNITTAAISSYTTGEGSGSATFVIDPSYADALTYENLDPLTGYPYSTPLTIAVTLDGVAATVETGDYNVKGMFDSYGFYYETIILENGQVWLDRNVGAASNEVEVPVFTYQDVSNYVLDATGSEYIINSDYKSNYASYGKYFQRGQNLGVPITYGQGNNPYKASETLTYTGTNSSLLAKGQTVAYTESTPIQQPDDPFIYPSTNSAGLTGRDNGVWTSYDTSKTTNYTSNETNYLVNVKSWNLTEDGGTYNPCPAGYRVPTNAELANMLETVTGTTDYSEGNATNIPRLVEKMKLGFAGYTNKGPQAETLTDAADFGMIGAVGLVGNSTYSTAFQHYYGDYGYAGKTASTPPYMGCIALMMYDFEYSYLSGIYKSDDYNSSTSYVRIMIGYANTGAIELTTGHWRESAAPVRCIMNCDDGVE